MAEEFKLVTEDVSSSLWELVDKALAIEQRDMKLTVATQTFSNMSLIHSDFQKLTQAFAPLLAPLAVTIALLAHQHPLQFLALLLLPLTGKLRAGLLVLQHVLNVLPHLLKVAVLC